MADSSQSLQLVPDVSELMLSNDSEIATETYMFEPASHEIPLGYLIAVGETKNPLGKDLLDLVVTTIQREYYRSPSRGMVRSFESALHQANLVLNDTADQGVRDWMQHFHVAVGVLHQSMLHISVAGQASVSLVRATRFTDISFGLAHSITTPLRCFSQVASGTIAARDIIFFGTCQFSSLFPEDFLQEIAVERSASKIALAFKEQYKKQGFTQAVAITTVSLLPQEAVIPNNDREHNRALSGTFPHSPLPRKPLIMNSSGVSRFFQTIYQITKMIVRTLRQKLWPHIKRGSQVSSRIVVSTSKNAWQNVHALARRNQDGSLMSTSISPSQSMKQRLQALPRMLAQAPRRLGTYVWHLPRISKVFIGITLVLAIAFCVSLVLLRNKRIEDANIQRASELLHQATTKQQAAANLLIYGDRKQALTLLNDAEGLTTELTAMNVYSQEVAALEKKIQEERDKTQRIWRVSEDTMKTIGDFSTMTEGTNLTQIFLIDNTLFTFNPKTNAVLSLNTEGHVQAATTTTREIGFLTRGIPHEADKTIIFLTDEPGIVVFDSTSGTLEDQEIALPANSQALQAMATYSNRLYLYDSKLRTIYGYNKTLRGYSGGAPWLTDSQQLQGSVVDLAVDGFIYTLTNTGQIQKFYKGAPETFAVEAIDPPLESAKRIITSNDLRNIYILDERSGRIIIINKKGQLEQQLYVSGSEPVFDMAISPDEKRVYALVGQKVIEITLSQ